MNSMNCLTLDPFYSNLPRFPVSPVSIHRQLSFVALILSPYHDPCQRRVGGKTSSLQRLEAKRE
jgi:hypothetical protein